MSSPSAGMRVHFYPVGHIVLWTCSGFCLSCIQDFFYFSSERIRLRISP